MKLKKSMIYLKQFYPLYLMMLPAIIYLFIFNYLPIYGIQIAFKDFNLVKGISGSPFVGFEHFERFFKSYNFTRLLSNTVLLSLFNLIVGFPVPVIAALFLNQMGNEKYKKVIQTVTYAPHFISIVVLVGMLNVFLSPRIGFVNKFLELFSMDPIFFMGDATWFRKIFVLSNLWQNLGWGMIIYLAALTSIPPSLYESSMIDGANKLQRIWYIDLPSIMPTVVILFILRIGRIMQVGFQQVLLMSNSMNIKTSDIIQTYAYNIGFQQGKFDYAAAIGLFNTAVNIFLLITFNKLSKKIASTSLW